MPVKKGKMTDKCTRALKHFENLKKYNQPNTPSGKESPFYCLDVIENNVVYRNDAGIIVGETDRINKWITRAKNKETNFI